MRCEELDQGDVAAQTHARAPTFAANMRQTVIAVISTCALPAVYLSMMYRSLQHPLTYGRAFQLVSLVSIVCYLSFWLFLLVSIERRRVRYFTVHLGDMMIILLSNIFGPLVLISLYLAPLEGDEPQHLTSPDTFLSRLVFFSFLTAATGMDLDLFMPPIILLNAPLCSILAVASSLRIKHAHSQDPAIPLDALSALSTPTLCFSIFALVLSLQCLLILVSVAMEDERKNVTTSSLDTSRKPLTSAFPAPPSSSDDPLVDALHDMQDGLKSMFSRIPILSNWIQTLIDVRLNLRSSWRPADAATLRIAIWPIVMAYIALQLYRISWGLSASPLEVLVLFFAGLVLGTVEGKDVQLVTRGALSAVSALAHDLVPEHIVQALLARETSGGVGVVTSGKSSPVQQLQKANNISPASSGRPISLESLVPSAFTKCPTSPHGLADLSSLLANSCLESEAAESSERPTTGKESLNPEKKFHSIPSRLSRHVSRRISETLRTLTSLGSEGSQQLPTIQMPDIPNTNLVAYQHECVTILFADLCNFTDLSSKLDPTVMFAFLNELYARYDAVVEKYDVYKVETIGDCYMAATGLIRPDPRHASKMVEFALEMQHLASQVYLPDGSGDMVKTRIGIHSGPVLSGVIGMIRKRYCVVGSTVNVASRMESTGQQDRIHISKTTHEWVTDDPEGPEVYEWENRGEVQVKGIGQMQTFFLKQRTRDPSESEVDFLPRRF